MRALGRFARWLGLDPRPGEIGDVDFHRWHHRAVTAVAERRWDDALAAIREARDIEAAVMVAHARIVPGCCPHCGNELSVDVPTDGRDAGPRDGDVAICAACCGLLMFEGGRRRSPSAAELAELLRDPLLDRLVRDGGSGRRYRPWRPKP